MELKEFWDQMLSPMQATPTPQPQPRGSALSYVEETELRQLEEEGYTNSWAITADSKVIILYSMRIGGRKATLSIFIQPH